MADFDFCPKYMVPKTRPPQAASVMSMNGWPFTSRPKVPYQKSFTVKLQGMYWYLSHGGPYDEITNPRYNARRLELFYEEHGLWKPFNFPHPHLGVLECRFEKAVEVPESMAASGGLIDAFEINLVEHNPRY